MQRSLDDLINECHARMNSGDGALRAAEDVVRQSITMNILMELALRATGRTEQLVGDLHGAFHPNRAIARAPQQEQIHQSHYEQEEQAPMPSFINRVRSA